MTDAATPERLECHPPGGERDRTYVNGWNDCLAAIPSTRDRDGAIAMAVKTCIEFGFYGTNKPPEGHWLNEMWDCGRALSSRATEPDRNAALTEAAEEASNYLAAAPAERKS